MCRMQNYYICMQKNVQNQLHANGCVFLCLGPIHTQVFLFQNYNLPYFSWSLHDVQTWLSEKMNFQPQKQISKQFQINHVVHLNVIEWI